jgi:catabolite regulation protein CreA
VLKSVIESDKVVEASPKESLQTTPKLEKKKRGTSFEDVKKTKIQLTWKDVVVTYISLAS